MTKNGQDYFAAAAGAVIRITVESVNFVNNAQLDPLLTVVNGTDFSKVGQFTMGNSDATFVVIYNFPDPLPDGGKYTRTITGPGGFSDGPFDIVSIGGESVVVLPYMVKLKLEAAAPSAHAGIMTEETHGIPIGGGVTGISAAGAAQAENDSPDAYRYEVWYATNRQRSMSKAGTTSFANRAARDGAVSYGKCIVDVPKAHQFGSLGTRWWKRWVKLEFADDHLRLVRTEPFAGGAEFFSMLRNQLSSFTKTERQILVYLHGYNVTFKEAAIRAAQIGFDLKIDGHCCPVKSRTESAVCLDRVNRFGIPMAGVPAKGAFSQRARG